ncbi:MAG: hypothetical protein ABJB34_03695 [Acidobacteriota bacterium]
MRKFLQVTFAVALAFFANVFTLHGQSIEETNPGRAKVVKAALNTSVSSSAAYAELVLKRTELQSELESLILEYTEEFPKVKEDRLVVSLIDHDIARLNKVKSSDSAKLTLALGKLMVRRIELAADVWKLQGSYNDEHPDVKRAKRKVEIYEAAVNEILN